MNVHLRPVVLFLILLFFTTTATAMSTFESGDSVIIREDVDNDLYIAGAEVTITGDVNGDLFAAGGLVTVLGNVSGDVMVAAGDVIIKGNVGDDGRIAAGKVAVYGNVEDDLMLAGGEVITSANTTIGGDLICSGNEMIILSTVKGDLRAEGDYLQLGGTISGDALIDVREYTQLTEGSIEGNKTHKVVPDTIRKEKPDKEERTGPGLLSIILWIMKYIFLLTVGAILILLMPQASNDIAANIQKAPLNCLIAGVLTIIGAILGSVILMITVIGIPLGLLILLLLIFTLLLAKIYTGLWIGQWLTWRYAKEYPPWKELATGLLILLILIELPWIGAVISTVATLLGIGSIYLTVKPEN